MTKHPIPDAELMTILATLALGVKAMSNDDVRELTPEMRKL